MGTFFYNGVVSICGLLPVFWLLKTYITQNKFLRSVSRNKNTCRPAPTPRTSASFFSREWVHTTSRTSSTMESKFLGATTLPPWNDCIQRISCVAPSNDGRYLDVYQDTPGMAHLWPAPGVPRRRARAHLHPPIAASQPLRCQRYTDGRSGSIWTSSAHGEGDAVPGRVQGPGYSVPTHRPQEH